MNENEVLKTEKFYCEWKGRYCLETVGLNDGNVFIKVNDV